VILPQVLAVPQDFVMIATRNCRVYVLLAIRIAPLVDTIIMC